MEENKGQKIYRSIMLVIITALITALVTTIIVYKKIDNRTNIDTIAASKENSGLELTLSRIRTMLDNSYIGTLDDKSMIEGAIKGYVSGVGDQYTEYYTKEEMQDRLEEITGNYVGIGIYMIVDSSSGTILVTEPIEGSPAEKAGIKAGDFIVNVEGEDVTVENVSNMSNKIKGEEGTKVKIKVKRGKETIDFEIERKKIVVSHIKARVLENNIGYINIKDFDGGTADEFKTKYEELSKKGIKSLIIDIRSNGGGIVDESLNILDMLLEKDTTLLITVNKKQEEEVTKAKKKQEIDIPVIVLTNQYSASASEILAGALKDNGRAKIVGTKTYGKGVIQTLRTLTDGSGLKTTTEEYYTPNRNKINKIGIKPDYEVNLPEDIEELTDENDTQLKKAIEFLK